VEALDVRIGKLDLARICSSNLKVALEGDGGEAISLFGEYHDRLRLLLPLTLWPGLRSSRALRFGSP
jgi:hypothetical protein